MKKTILYIISTFVALVMSSCTKSSDMDVAGEWHLVSSGDTDMELVDVYISFNGGSFEILQKLGEGRYWIYTGTYAVSGSILTGSYNDGSPLGGGSYDVKLEESGSRLVMTALNGSSEVSTYTRMQIPAEIRSEAVPAVKSSAENGQAPSPIF